MIFGISDVLAVVFLFIILGVIYWYWTIPKNLPPGPRGLPLIGSWFDHRSGSGQQVVLLRQLNKYGPLMHLYIANKLVVVLGNYDTIQEALVKQGDIFAGRPNLYTFLPKRMQGYGVIFTEGDLWKEQRRFALSTLRDFGVGRPIIESKIREEIEHLSDRLREYARTGSAIDPQPLLICAVANVISQLIFGRRYSYDDKDFVNQFTALSKRVSGSGIGFLSPFVLSDRWALIAQWLPLMRRVAKEANEFLDYCELQLKNTMETFDSDSEPSNYVHAYQKAAEDQKLESSFTYPQLMCTALDIFMAGTETTSTSLRYALLLIGSHPEVQEKLYKEIQDEIGSDSLPEYADRAKLPFAEAVVMEIQRFADLTPFGVPRRTLEPTKLMGYDIPADATVVPFLHNVLLNEDLFQNPSLFDPTRFLDSNGKVHRDPNLIPFQAGKRICLGEPLARMELFLFLVGLVSRFKFYFKPGEKMPDLKPVVGLICSPAPYKIYIETR